MGFTNVLRILLYRSVLLKFGKSYVSFEKEFHIMNLATSFSFFNLSYNTKKDTLTMKNMNYKEKENQKFYLFF